MEDNWSHGTVDAGLVHGVYVGLQSVTGNTEGGYLALHRLCSPFARHLPGVSGRPYCGHHGLRIYGMEMVDYPCGSY